MEPEGAELYNSNLTTLPDMDTVKEELYGDEIVLAETLERKREVILKEIPILQI